MTINIKELLEDYVDKHGELEVDGEYGEQCKPEEFLEALIKKNISRPFYKRLRERSKQVLDEKETEKWMEQQ